MKNDGYEISKKYYNSIKRMFIAFLFSLIGAIISLLSWHIFKNPILALIGAIVVILAITSMFIISFYAAYLFIRLLFAKWPRRD
ncbi:MAG: hypothetical protein LBL65_01505 [Campylobacteraceae bacterium]|jgi:NhaP-type Na+/H+ or K+/H+ antiporter|nr:hypothetical protein [Campylobacteraceae bacterium]